MRRPSSPDSFGVGYSSLRKENEKRKGRRLWLETGDWRLPPRNDYRTPLDQYPAMARVRFGLVALALVAVSCADSFSGPVSERNGVSVYPADWPCANGRPDEVGLLHSAPDIYTDPRVLGWPTATPEAVGLDVALLEQAMTEVGRAPRVNSLLIVRHGRLVAERYFNGAEASDARNAHSATKSLTALLVGIAIEDGYIPDLDTTMGELIPDVIVGSALAEVTIEDMLSMSAGVAWNDDVTPFESTTMLDGVLDAERIAEPGTVFEYNSGLSDLLAFTMDRLVPGGLCEYAHSRLFAPLGIDIDHWHENPEGSVTGGGNAYLTPREFARIGQLVLDGGMSNGRQVVPEAWLETIVDPRFELATPAIRRTGRIVSYGLHWWIHDLDGVRILNASGYGGQNLFVIPSLDMVVVLTHDTSAEPDRQVPWEDLISLFVLPAAGDTVDECPCPPDLVVAHPDGTGRVALAPHAANDLTGDWSPDGSRIAFHSFRDLNAELYVVNADGTGLRRFTFHWALDGNPRWSPDGTHLVFISDRSAENLYNLPVVDAHVMDVATGETNQVTEGMGGVRYADWTPDGNHIVFVQGVLDDFTGMGELWMLDLASGATEMLLAGPVGFPAVSPDGTTIALEIPGETTGAPLIALFDLESGRIAELGPGTLPAWLSDGSQVFATGATLMVYNVSDGTSTNFPSFTNGVPSPDGEWILFTD